MRLSLTILALLGLLLTTYSQSYLIEKINLVPLTNSQTNDDVYVYVVDGKIAQLSSEKIDVPKKVIKVDGRDKYLLPGLIDCYAHINKENLPLFIANGITTVRNAPGALFQHALKQQIDQNRLIGPSIYSTSPPIAGSRPYYHTQGLIEKPEDVDLALKEIRNQGYDAVFVYATIEPHLYDRLIESARNMDMKMEGHVPYMVNPQTYTSGPQRSFENLVSIINTQTGTSYLPKTYLPDFAAQLALSQKVVIPSLTIHKIRSLTNNQDSLRERPEMEYLSPRQQAYWKLNAPNYVYKDAREVVSILHKSGVGILIGTDAGFPFVVAGYSYLDEVRNLRDAGLTNQDILEAATVDAARFLELDDRGTVEEGKVADLIILDKNPLEDIENIASINRVFLRGRMLDKAGIDAMLDEIQNMYSQSSKKRFKTFVNPSKQYLLVAEYEIMYRETTIGSERIFSTLDETKWITQNIIDPMRSIANEMEWSFTKDNVLSFVRLKRSGDEGITTVSYNAEKDELLYDLPIYGKGSFNLNNDNLSSDLVLGPLCSVNADMDLIANYQIIINQYYNQTKDSLSFTANRIGLNSEEWGRNHIAGPATYTLRKIASSESLETLAIVQPGLNNMKRFSYEAIVEIDNKGIIENISFDDGNIQVRRKK